MVLPMGMATEADPVVRARTAVRAALRDYRDIDLSWLGSPPPDDGWGLAPDALRFATSLLRAVRPRHVVEFGCGLSTRVLVHSCAELGDGATVTSIENDPQFRHAAKESVADVNGSVKVVFPEAPLVAREWAGRMHPTYLFQQDGLGSDCPADIVLVDGPPSFLGGRSGTLHQAFSLARAGTILILDDADRSGEAAALAEWREHYGDRIEITVATEFTKGLALILLRDAPA
jgi:predicted O-methyltransferase YrrM